MALLDESGLKYLWSQLKEKFAAKGHTHDDRYYTEAEVNTKLAGKSDTGHTHDDRYYTETEADAKFYRADLDRTKATVLAAPASADGKASFRVLTKSDIGLSNVDNTADSKKSVYYATYSGTANALDPNNSYGSIPKAVRPMFDNVRANRLAFLPADQIIIEKTVDGGKTWTDAGISDWNKRSLFAGTGGGFQLPQIDGKKNALCGIRLTITAMKYNVPSGTAETDKYKYWNNQYVTSNERYCTLGDLYIWVSGGIDNIAFTLERACGSTSTSWNTLFSSESAKGYLNGWSGPNYIKFSEGTFGGGTGQTSNYWNYRFTFMSHAANGSTFNSSYITQSQSVGKIMGYGASVWQSSNYLMGNDHMYGWDVDKNVSFPAQVAATQFNGPSTSAQKLTTTTAGSATQPVYFANGVPAACTYTLGKSVPSDAKFTDTNTWRGVQDNLTSTATDQSLSANQGKVLKGIVDGKADNTEAGINALLMKLPTNWSAEPTDDTYFIHQDTAGASNFGRLKFSTVWTYIKGKADTAYQAKGNYAGSASAGGSATSAVKLDTATAGSATQPVYFTGGKPAACSYTLGKSVPSDAKFTDTTYGLATSGANGLMAAADKAKLDALGGIVTIQKSLKLTTDWMDTGIAGENLESGTYIIQVSGMTNDNTRGFYNETYSGVMTWFSAMTNSTGVDEIPLHNAGHAENGHEIYLRTARSNAGSDQKGRLKLQIAANQAGVAADTITFKFRKMI